jgi:hypothetical protein
VYPLDRLRSSHCITFFLKGKKKKKKKNTDYNRPNSFAASLPHRRKKKNAQRFTQADPDRPEKEMMSYAHNRSAPYFFFFFYRSKTYFGWGYYIFFGSLCSSVRSLEPISFIIIIKMRSPSFFVAPSWPGKKKKREMDCARWEWIK